MARFKIGDRVRLVSLIDPEGLTYGTGESNKVGNVVSIIGLEVGGWGGDIDAYNVKWDNGTINSYYGGNLRKLSLNMRNK